jgi:hypothetical protein
MRQGRSALLARIGIILGLLLGLVVGLLLLLDVVGPWFDDDTKPHVYQAFLSDLNGDGSLDAFLVYLNELNRVALNDGQGGFTIARRLYMRSYALALGDIYGDGQVSAIINNFDGQQTELLCAQAPPGFSIRPTAVAGSGQYLATRDFNDGSAATFLAGCCKGGTVIYNYETFSNPSPCLSEGASAIALADLNGSGALDAFLAKGRLLSGDGRVQRSAPNEVWFNDGQGDFTDSGQRLGNAESLAVVVGDLNGDGHPDAVVGNRGPDEVWLNDGQGSFSATGQRLGSGASHSLFLADLDGDGSLDLFAAGDTSGRAWLNDGAGRFREGQYIRGLGDKAIALGDVTGDGLVDLFVAGLDSYQIWRGTGEGGFTPGPETGYYDQ